MLGSFEILGKDTGEELDIQIKRYPEIDATEWNALFDLEG